MAFFKYTEANLNISTVLPGLVTAKGTSGWAGSPHGVQTLGQGTSHSPGGTESLYHSTQSGVQFEAYELVFRIFHLIFSDQGSEQITLRKVKPQKATCRRGERRTVL